MKRNKQKKANNPRIIRKIHRITALWLSIFFTVIAVTGILLGWKKNSGGFISPKSSKGVSTNLEDWLPVDSLYNNACRFLHDSVSEDLLVALNRIDIRKNKGIVKFIFEKHSHEIQLDGSTGRLLQITFRRSDLIENIHDGSFIDRWFGFEGSPFKLIYTSITGIALLICAITGFLLWLEQRKSRKKHVKFY